MNQEAIDPELGAGMMTGGPENLNQTGTEAMGGEM